MKAYNILIRKLLTEIKNEKSRLESLAGRHNLTKPTVTILKELRKYINDSLYSNTSINLNKYQNASNENDILSDVQIALDSILSRDHVTWISYEDEQICSISKNFLKSYSNFLRQLVIYNKVIFMSGTLAANDSFDHIINLWGLDKKHISTKIYETSFDYKNQAIMYIPTGLLHVSQDKNPEYMEKQLKSIKQLLSMTNGRTLLLTTSKKDMQSIHLGIKEELKDKNVNLYLQGTASVESLSKRFKVDIDSVLVGSGSFFSGLSVKGESLESVVLSRLPYPVKDDPFISLLEEGVNKEEGFSKIIFPQMMIKLKQAAGRLIRDISDYGIVTILDSRIFASKAGPLIREEFEKLGYTITRDFSTVQEFYKTRKFNPVDIMCQEYKRSEIKLSESLIKEDTILKKLSSNKIIIQHTPRNKKSDSTSDKQQYYTYFGKRIPISRVTMNTDTGVTQEQYDFVIRMQKTYGIRSTKVKDICDSYELFKFIYDAFVKRLFDTSIIVSGFPYINDRQKDIYSKYSSKVKPGSRYSPIKVTKLSKEELDKLFR
jgi:ATP-dependent DNA helicase DinG